MSHLHILLEEGLIHSPILHIKRILFKQWRDPVLLSHLIKEQDLVVWKWPVEAEMFAECGREIAG